MQSRTFTFNIYLYKYIALFFLVFITLYPLKFALEDAVGRVPCKFENWIDVMRILDLADTFPILNLQPSTYLVYGQ